MISTPFADALAARRDDFNARVRAAQRRFPGLRTAPFLDFLSTRVDGIVGAVAAIAPERVTATAVAAFDIALELAGRNLIGAPPPGDALDAAWHTLMPCLDRLVAAQPQYVLSMVSNAAIYLADLPGTRCDQWLHDMRGLAPCVDSVDQLRIVGQIVAWRAGAAHFRAGAIAAADGLPDALALRAFSAAASSSWAALRARVEHDPWWQGDDGQGASERDIGSFTGFGGPFPAPPTIRAADGAFAVRAGDRFFVLVADAYGAVLRPSARDAFDRLPPDAGRCGHAMRAGCLTVGGQGIPIDLPDAGLAVCATATTIAIASPFTHAVRVLKKGAP